MASLNFIALIGNVGQDAEMKYSNQGTAVTQFSLAVNDRKDETQWFRCVMFGERAEKVTQYITKGKSLYVSGRLQMRNWTDDNGTKHYRTEVVASDIQFLDRKGGSTDDDMAWE